MWLTMLPPLRLARLQIAAHRFCESSISLSHSTAPEATAVTRSSRVSYSLSIAKPIFPSQSSAASFSTTSSYLKKGASKARRTTPTSSTDHIPDNKAQRNRDRDIDPFDFSELEANIKHQIDRLRVDLQKLRSGGRLSPETIEGFQVEIKHGLAGEGGQGKKVERLRLGDLATVVPRGGRLIAVMLNEEAVRIPWPSSYGAIIG
jgi:hypothetical protein